MTDQLRTALLDAQNDDGTVASQGTRDAIAPNLPARVATVQGEAAQTQAEALSASKKANAK